MAHAEHYVTPKKTLIQVFLALVTLTAITIVAARTELGVLNLPIALTIAFLKASLVVVIFMALKSDNRMHAVVFLVGAVFVVIFLVLTLFDTAYRGDLPNTVEGTIMEEQAEIDALRARDPGPRPTPPNE
ncbi:MAG: hypothetical protein BMS9Abin05_1379 [Rhodothermia bacterium]|nr:MAG: hypothetical protein BMS9Abin05_1379 [Rhodothermia bacterium]